MSKKSPKHPPAVPTFAIAQQFKPKESVVVEINDPMGEPTPIRITLAGRYTAAFKAAAALVRETSAEAPDDAFARIAALVVAATTAWEGVLDGDGKAMPCTPELVKALYEHPDLPWLFPQVSVAFLDTSRFFERAKTS